MCQATHVGKQIEYKMDWNCEAIIFEPLRKSIISKLIKSMDCDYGGIKTKMYSITSTRSKNGTIIQDVENSSWSGDAVIRA